MTYKEAKSKGSQFIIICAKSKGSQFIIICEAELFLSVWHLKSRFTYIQKPKNLNFTLRPIPVSDFSVAWLSETSQDLFFFSMTEESLLSTFYSANSI